MTNEKKRALSPLSLGIVLLVVLWGWGYFVKPSDAMVDRIISVVVFVAGAECVKRSLPNMVRDLSQHIRKGLARLSDIAYFACFFALIFTTTWTQFIIPTMTLFLLLFVSSTMEHVPEEKRIQPWETMN